MTQDKKGGLYLYPLLAAVKVKGDAGDYHEECPEEGVAVLPGEFGDGGTSVFVLEVHSVETGEELPGNEHRGNERERVEDGTSFCFGKLVELVGNAFSVFLRGGHVFEEPSHIAPDIRHVEHGVSRPLLAGVECVCQGSNGTDDAVELGELHDTFLYSSNVLGSEFVLFHVESFLEDQETGVVGLGDEEVVFGQVAEHFEEESVGVAGAESRVAGSDLGQNFFKHAHFFRERRVLLRRGGRRRGGSDEGGKFHELDPF